MEKHAGVLPKADGEIKKCCRNVSCSTFALKRSTLNCPVLELFETSASTDSAIWASKRVQRYDKNLK